MLQPMTVGTTTGGAGFLGMLSAYGLSILIGGMALVVFALAVAWFRRTNANSRGNEKKF